ncbi:hypothetical protein [Acaryochloris marina]|uniref:hypothetical protein n=1 Tax=Acaryochloris marina TaxID=155978 RepID=UPI0011D08E24|nr:hypothetical protein [Acaryochloris marina]
MTSNNVSRSSHTLSRSEVNNRVKEHLDADSLLQRLREDLGMDEGAISGLSAEFNSVRDGAPFADIGGVAIIPSKYQACELVAEVAALIWGKI